MKKFMSFILVLMLCLSMISLTAQAENIEPGTYVTFGTYEQDNDASNSAEPIEWLVLETEGNKALLISRYGLDSKPYNTDYVDVTWENCTLRAWLNSEFINEAFSENEQAMILTTTVDNSDSQGYDFTAHYDYAEPVTGGNNTEDKVFLLSYAEVSKYFEVTFKNDKNSGARVAPTEFAKQHSAKVNKKKKTTDGAKAGWWWLRSPGTVQSYAARVGDDGALSLDCVFNKGTCVRPVIWVDLGAGSALRRTAYPRGRDRQE